MFDWFKKRPAQPVIGPDFSQIDSLAKAQAMCQRGELEKMYLMPLAFGGDDHPHNVLYVPIGLADVKDGIDLNVIGPLAEQGTITKYKAEPEYQGKSVIPISVKITAYDPGEFVTTINIWGAALGR